ncbi:MAG: stage III sporulation protein AB [Firmicutes bacterium]|nr:stage III sporulation protein AB [Bacillota bacterium]
MFFLRLSLCLIIIGASGAAGWILSGSIRERPRQLRSLQAALSRLETEISCSMTFLPEALQELGRLTAPPVNRLFADAAELLLLGDLSIQEAWRQAVLKAREYLVLTRDDEQILLDLGDNLGISHREDQSRHLRLARNALSQQEAEAQRAEEQLVRLYSALGWAAGGALVLIMA